MGREWPVWGWEDAGAGHPFVVGSVSPVSEELLLVASLCRQRLQRGRREMAVQGTGQFPVGLLGNLDSLCLSRQLHTHVLLTLVSISHCDQMQRWPTLSGI